MIHKYAGETLKMGKYGCFSRLWAETIQWYEAGVNTGPGEFIESLSVHKIPKPSDLHCWWVRAAQAHGHAEWLIKERRDARTVGHTQAIESWRLLPSGTVLHYDNSCGPWLVWFIVHGKSKDGVDGPEWYSDDDDFLMHFNIISDMMHGEQSINTGWPLHSYLYGALVSFGNLSSRVSMLCC